VSGSSPESRAEYLGTLPPPNQQQGSEFGHLIRITVIKWKVESSLRSLVGKKALLQVRFLANSGRR
jgi:hypothetical protein